ncbi:MAG: hypothetical protein EOP38_20505 [Rubrivivax sp.]|nr:MAG: hypothetical protein EOP38_20505 [Rubrivivax sp.]
MAAPLSEVSRAILELLEHARQAAVQAAAELVEVVALTWRDCAARLPHVDAQTVRRTFENLMRAGKLERAGHVKVPGSRRPMLACRLPMKAQAQMVLADAMGSWMRGPAIA